MSDTSPTHDVEVEEGSPMGGGTCEDSSPEPPLQPTVEYGDSEQIEEHEDNHYPFDSLAVELYEGPEEDNASHTQPDISHNKVNSGEIGRASGVQNIQAMVTVHQSDSAEQAKNENIFTASMDTGRASGVHNIQAIVTVQQSDSAEHAKNENIFPASMDIGRAGVQNIQAMVHQSGSAEHAKNENIFTENSKSNIENSMVESHASMLSCSSSSIYEPSIDMKEDGVEPDYKELQKAYIEDFYCSSAAPSHVACDTDEIRGLQLSRFPRIAKAVESSDYETLQTLYQLLYQRSAWDTQEILVQRILGFSGFNFGKESEDYFNREMMLRTLPDNVLMKIASILGLDMNVRNMMLGLSKAKMDLICLMLEFLSKPQKKTRVRAVVSVQKTQGSDGSFKQKIFGDEKDENPENSNTTTPTEKCGCRNQCLKKFTENDKKNLLEFLEELRKRKMLDSFIASLMTCKKIERTPSDQCKKLKEVLYTYKVKMGNKEVNVCKGGFLSLNGLKMAKINQLQNKLKRGIKLPALKPEKMPCIPMSELPDTDTTLDKGLLKVKKETPTKEIAALKPEEPTIDKATLLKIEEELKGRINLKVPKVVVEKFDLNSLHTLKPTQEEDKTESEAEENSNSLDEKESETTQTKKLKDFPLVVKSINSAQEELLIDIHFLLFLNSAEVEKVKDNILEFSGFSFDMDTEEYDERKEFLLRMSNKIVAGVAKSFSLTICSKKEDTIKNILSFLRKPEESFLKTTGSAPVILSDVEFDDMDNMSDSDVSITCEVVEKKVECIDLISSGEESDKDNKPAKIKSKVPSPKKPPPAPQVQKEIPTTSATTSQTVSATNADPSQSKRALKDFETICKIVNTHPHEYLIDIFDLLYMKKHEPSTLRKDILEFTGFTFDKGSPEYVKRKHLLDRMLYNSVRRIYNTLIHNTTEVKIYSKPTMIAEIFQFLFKLPDHDTSVRPAQNRPPVKPSLVKNPTVVRNVASVVGAAQVPEPPSSVPQGKLSDLKRVFQRVACFPCEYLTDVHKLLFMTDCDSRVIRQNIFGFKGFSFSVDSPEFQQRKMYLEYLTFHSLRKISSVLTTRSVDLRNSTKHELATHLTQVLAEYTNTYVETEPIGPPDSSNESPDNENTSVLPPSDTEVENIVVTPIIEPLNNASPPPSPPPEVPNSTISSSSDSVVADKAATVEKPVKDPVVSKASNPALPISIVDARSVGSPAVSTTSSPKSRRKRKQNFDANPTKKIAPQPDPSQFADINLPEFEQYRQLYGSNLNLYSPNVPTMTGITTFTGPNVVQQPYPQTLAFPMMHSYPQPMQVQSHYSTVPQTSQVLGLQPQLGTPMMPTGTAKPNEVIVPGENAYSESTNDSNLQKAKLASKEKILLSSDEKHNKIRDAVEKDDEEDCDKPLSSLIGHPIDSVLKKQICDIVEQTDLQDITINGVIQKIYNMYPKFDLSYRKEFIKSTLRAILYRLGDQNPAAKSNSRETNSPDCSVTTTNTSDNAVQEPEVVLDISA